MDIALALLGLSGRIGWGNKFTGNSAGHIFIPEQAERCKHLKNNSAQSAVSAPNLREIGIRFFCGKIGRERQRRTSKL